MRQELQLRPRHQLHGDGLKAGHGLFTMRQAALGMFQRSKAPRLAGSNFTREATGGSKAG